MAYFEIDTTVSIDDSDLLDILHGNDEALEFAKNLADQLDEDDLKDLHSHVRDLLKELL